jgi:hypothetical protein
MPSTVKKLLRKLLYTFLLLVACNALLNLYVNPYGFFGDLHVGSGPIFNARYDKHVNLLTLDTKPEVIVMGSSNSMRMRPQSIQELTGLPSYNYGVYHARAEDFYCIGQLLTADEKTTPKAIILCLDDWNLADEPALPDEVFAGAEKRLAYKPLLARHLDDYSVGKLFWARFKAALSWTHTKASLDALRSAKESADFSRKQNPLAAVFFKDGVRKNYGSVFGDDVTDLAESGEYDVGTALKTHHEEMLGYSQHHLGFITTSHEMFEKFSDRRWNYLDRFFDRMDTAGVKVILNVMPNQPFYQQLVREHGNYDERISIFLKRLNELEEKHDCIILLKDNHNIENFGGSEHHFFDHMHPTSVNSDLMLKSIFEALPANALQ